MSAKPWPTPHWPDGVAHDISGFEKPLYTILDDAAQNYPDQAYTVFNGAARTFARVKNTADKIANFLVAAPHLVVKSSGRGMRFR